MLRRTWFLASLVVLLAALPGYGSTSAQAAELFPTTIALPNGWQPEGIVTGRGPVIYSGSLATGAIYAADLRTGNGHVLVPPQPGRVAVGLDFDRRTNYIFVAGGATGDAYVYDANSGATVMTYTLALTTSTFVNDEIVTRNAVYFTDSSQPVLYKLPLGPGGRLPAQNAVTAIPLKGDYQQVPGINANGIVASQDGKWLIVVHTVLGKLYRVDPTTGNATSIDLGGASVVDGDGLLLQGRTLYVVQNMLNQVAVVELANNLLHGTVTATITSPSFDVPTTIARFGERLYVVNARFTTPPTPDTTYTIVQVPR